MTRTCKYPSCDQDAGQEETDSNYRSGRFCSVAHDVKYDHLVADARDAQRAEQEEQEP